MIKNLDIKFQFFIKPQWFKDLIFALVNTLGIPIVLLDDEKMFYVAEFISHKEKECLFLVNSIIVGLHYKLTELSTQKSRIELMDSEFIIKYIFGKRGANELFQAFESYGKKNKELLDETRQRSIAFVSAMNGHHEEIKKLHDYKECIVVGSLTATRFNIKVVNGHDDLALIGLSNRAFNHIFLDENFEKYIKAQVFLNEANKVINKFWQK